MPEVAKPDVVVQMDSEPEVAGVGAIEEAGGTARAASKTEEHTTEDTDAAHVTSLPLAQVDVMGTTSDATDAAAPSAANPFDADAAVPSAANPFDTGAAAPSAANPFDADAAAPSAANPFDTGAAAPSAANPFDADAAVPSAVNPFDTGVAAPSAANPFDTTGEAVAPPAPSKSVAAWQPTLPPTLAAGNGAGDAAFKIIVVGDSGVGKTCLLVRFAEGRYNHQGKATVRCSKCMRRMCTCTSQHVATPLSGFRTSFACTF